ncbi:MAG: hypothetical protein IPM96_20450 [Ignavibacteria bacterium]|nr:hypothetical protein [Ignavibacteria bacterium]
MKHKVFEILKTFSKNEIIDFKDFLASPFFNDSKKLSKLLELLIKYHPQFQMTSITDNDLSRMISPQIEFNKSTMKALFSNLYKKSLEYLKVSNFLSKEIESSDFLREELFKRKLFKELNCNMQIIDDLLKKNMV